MICQWCTSEYHDSYYHPGTCGNCGGPKRVIYPQGPRDEFIAGQFGKGAKAYCDALNALEEGMENDRRILGEALIDAFEVTTFNVPVSTGVLNLCDGDTVEITMFGGAPATYTVNETVSRDGEFFVGLSRAAN